MSKENEDNSKPSLERSNSSSSSKKSSKRAIERSATLRGQLSMKGSQTQMKDEGKEQISSELHRLSNKSADIADSLGRISQKLNKGLEGRGEEELAQSSRGKVAKASQELAVAATKMADSLKTLAQDSERMEPNSVTLIRSIDTSEHLIEAAEKISSTLVMLKRLSSKMGDGIVSNLMDDASNTAAEITNELQNVQGSVHNLSKTNIAGSETGSTTEGRQPGEADESTGKDRASFAAEGQSGAWNSKSGRRDVEGEAAEGREKAEGEEDGEKLDEITLEDGKKPEITETLAYGGDTDSQVLTRPSDSRMTYNAMRMLEMADKIAKTTAQLSNTSASVSHGLNRLGNSAKKKVQQECDRSARVIESANRMMLMAQMVARDLSIVSRNANKMADEIQTHPSARIFPETEQESLPGNILELLLLIANTMSYIAQELLRGAHKVNEKLPQSDEAHLIVRTLEYFSERLACMTRLLLSLIGPSVEKNDRILSSDYGVGVSTAEQLSDEPYPSSLPYEQESGHAMTDAWAAIGRTQDESWASDGRVRSRGTMTSASLERMRTESVSAMYTEQAGSYVAPGTFQGPPPSQSAEDMQYPTMDPAGFSSQASGGMYEQSRLSRASFQQQRSGSRQLEPEATQQTEGSRASVAQQGSFAAPQGSAENVTRSGGSLQRSATGQQLLQAQPSLADALDEASQERGSESGLARQPSLGSRQASQAERQASFAGSQPSQGSRQALMEGRQPSMGSRQPSMEGRQASMGSRQPSMEGRQPSMGSRQPSLEGRQPSMGSRQASIEGGQPPVGSRQASQTERQASFAGRQSSQASRHTSMGSRHTSMEDSHPTTTGSRQASLEGRQASMGSRHASFEDRQPSLERGQTVEQPVQTEPDERGSRESVRERTGSVAQGSRGSVTRGSSGSIHRHSSSSYPSLPELSPVSELSSAREDEAPHHLMGYVGSMPGPQSKPMAQYLQEAFEGGSMPEIYQANEPFTVLVKGPDICLDERDIRPDRLVNTLGTWSDFLMFVASELPRIANALARLMRAESDPSLVMGAVQRLAGKTHKVAEVLVDVKERIRAIPGFLPATTVEEMQEMTRRMTETLLRLARETADMAHELSMVVGDCEKLRAATQVMRYLTKESESLSDTSWQVSLKLTELSRISMQLTSKASLLDEEPAMDAQYLRENMGLILSQCLVEVCQKQPWDPIEYIGQWLLHYRIAENKRQLEKDDAENLERERREDMERRVREKQMRLERLRLQEEARLWRREQRRRERDERRAEEAAQAAEKAFLEAEQAEMEAKLAEELLEQEEAENEKADALKAESEEAGSTEAGEDGAGVVKPTIDIETIDEKEEEDDQNAEN